MQIILFNSCALVIKITSRSFCKDISYRPWWVFQRGGRITCHSHANHNDQQSNQFLKEKNQVPPYIFSIFSSRYFTRKYVTIWMKRLLQFPFHANIMTQSLYCGYIHAAGHCWSMIGCVKNRRPKIESEFMEYPPQST